ncbi:MAG TPA: GNAT family N-acetyltransferase, partial [Phytomonospora sp.]
MLIRPAVPADVPARVAVHRACVSYSMANEALMASPDEPGARTLRLVAEVDGEVVGSGSAELDVHGAEGTGAVSVMVVPEHRGGGVGAALYRRLDAHLGEIGARRVTAYSFSEDAVGFGERRGFAIGLATRVSQADPAGVEPVAPPPGITVRSAADLPDLRAAHEVALAFGPDIPSSAPFVAQPYDAWVAARTSGIGLDRETSFVVFDG